MSHTFTGENRGNTPVVILDVVTTCGCTVPQFTKRPIRPGEKTTVKVTFDPANRPGAFTKELGVYSSERKKVATLTIRGNVTPRMKSTEELYPVDAGGGLRLSTTLNAFSYIRLRNAFGHHRRVSTNAAVRRAPSGQNFLFRPRHLRRHFTNPFRNFSAMGYNYNSYHAIPPVSQPAADTRSAASRLSK